MSKRFALTTASSRTTTTNSATAASSSSLLWQRGTSGGLALASRFTVAVSSNQHVGTTLSPSIWTRDFSSFSRENKNYNRSRQSSVFSSPVLQHLFGGDIQQRRTKTTDASEAKKVQYDGAYTLPHPIWPNEYIDSVTVTHVPPNDLTSKLAFWTVRLFRFNFDWMSGYMFGKLTENKFVNRMAFLETVAGVPGFIGGFMRHLHSLRRMRRDYGWIHTLVEEAENERIHLLTALQLKQPSLTFKAAVWLTQGIFTNWFFLTYMFYPSYCHRFVGYLEEEAVRTYTHALKEIDSPTGSLHEFGKKPAPEVSKKYWKLGNDATMRDVVLVVRADEAHHREVNHTLADLSLEGSNQPNPFLPGKHERHTFVEDPKVTTV